MPVPKRSRIFFLVLTLMGLMAFLSIMIWKVKSSDNSPVPLMTPVATTAWDVLLAQTPVAYTTPLPAEAKTPIDGTYAKIDQSRPQWWLCLRCADYRPAGGIWKLQFEQGVMRIYYEVTGWKSIASYAVAGDRLTLFNDPYCRGEVGEYTWKVEADGLDLEAVSDTCSFDLRAQNLSNQDWSVCPPVDAQLSSPPGCEDTLAIPDMPIPADLPVTVTVYGGDSRLFAQPPLVHAPANSADTPPPSGIEVTYHEQSIPYGLNRVLWWHGDWIEATTELPFTAMGVQFFGGPAIGWARVLFDGLEVWRGDTSAIATDKLGHYGGYVHISAITPGKHTIRVESLGFDYHPVTVSSFGFSTEDVMVVPEP